MKLLTKTFVALVVIYSMLLVTACPAKSIQRAKDGSAKIAKYANAGVNLTRTLYNSGVLPLAQKDEIALKFILLSKAGQTFDAAVENARLAYGTNAPAPEIEKLFATFNSEVVGRFLDVLQSLKAIGATEKYQAIIDAIRTAVLLVTRAFGRSASSVNLEAY